MSNGWVLADGVVRMKCFADWILRCDMPEAWREAKLQNYIRSSAELSFHYSHPPILPSSHPPTRPSYALTLLYGVKCSPAHKIV